MLHAVVSDWAEPTACCLPARFERRKGLVALGRIARNRPKIYRSFPDADQKNDGDDAHHRKLHPTGLLLQREGSRRSPPMEGRRIVRDGCSLHRNENDVDDDERRRRSVPGLRRKRGMKRLRAPFPPPPLPTHERSETDPGRPMSRADAEDRIDRVPSATPDEVLNDASTAGIGPGWWTLRADPTLVGIDRDQRRQRTMPTVSATSRRCGSSESDWSCSSGATSEEDQ